MCCVLEFTAYASCGGMKQGLEGFLCQELDSLKLLEAEACSLCSVSYRHPLLSLSCRTVILPLSSLALASH